jgi:hypothetical protein
MADVDSTSEDISNSGMLLVGMFPPRARNSGDVALVGVSDALKIERTEVANRGKIPWMNAAKVPSAVVHSRRDPLVSWTNESTTDLSAASPMPASTLSTIPARATSDAPPFSHIFLLPIIWQDIDV